VIVILTALEVEHAAVLACLTGTEKHSHRAGTLFEVGTLAGRPDARVALALVGMGNITAAALTERAMAEFEPSTVMFVGIAGALRDWLELGDVVVGTRVYAYHGGRSQDDEFLARPRAWEISHKAEQAARRLARSDDWRVTLPSSGAGLDPKVHFEPIAAGDVVLDSRTSETANRLRANYNDAVAVEMESAGFALAGHLNDHIPAITIRGISDHAGGAKDETDGEGWQEIAARNAAAFAVALAADLEDETLSPGQAAASQAQVPGPRNTNIATGNANVGQQFGNIFGGYHAGPHSERGPK
jgi:nucleoside phosphorylase